MSLSLAQRAPAKNGGSPPKSSETSAPASTQSRKDLLGNAALLQQVMGDAADQVKDQGMIDTKATLGVEEEDPGKFQIPEGPDSVQGTGTGSGATERKQQQDALPKLRDKHEGNKSYEDIKNGTPFIKGAGDAGEVDAHDVAQGSLGDCYFVAAMAAVARANPDAIKKLIKDNGDGTFDVTLYVRKNSWSTPTPVVKKVDARLPSNGGGSLLYVSSTDKEGDNRELWPSLLEKTLAQHKGSYNAIEGGQIANGFNFAGATEMLTGKAEGYKSTDKMSEDDILLEIGAALEAKKPVTVDSRDMSSDEAMSKEANALNVYGNHAYAPEKVDINARTISLQNPWGSHHVPNLPIATFKKYYRGVRIGA